MSRKAYLAALLFAFFMTVSWPGLWKHVDRPEWAFPLIDVWINCHLVLNFVGWALTLATQPFVDSSSALGFFGPQFVGAFIEALLIAWLWRLARSRRADAAEET